MTLSKSPAWQLPEEEHLRRFFSYFKVDCVFDVGANAGQYAEMLRGAVGYAGPIISFEPIPHLAALLRDKAHRESQWFVEEVALSSHEGMIPFNVMNNDKFSSLRDPTHSEVRNFEDMNRVVRVLQVKSERLETMYEKYRSLLSMQRPFLKMDTQGCDQAVVDSAGDKISAFIGLQSELSIKRIYENTKYYYEVIQYYLEKGFNLSALVPNNAGHFPDLIEIDCIMYRRMTS